ncbi:hypothetical protein [Fusibacter sp. 3D3]|uniref:hypothetical protein n=1 Tax=Fusibacter sp. 3D3 TaxID=1048380 RepID=UPI001112E2FB|nr:hypothetical protein [Fusibacter sp. 3D3]
MNLSYRTTNVTDSTGNTNTRLGTYVKEDGTILSMGEFLLQRDVANTLDDTTLEFSTEILDMPEVAGFGNEASWVSDT